MLLHVLPKGSPKYTRIIENMIAKRYQRLPPGDLVVKLPEWGKLSHPPSPTENWYTAGSYPKYVPELPCSRPTLLFYKKRLNVPHSA